MCKSSILSIHLPNKDGILFFCPGVNLPGFCLLVICFGKSHGQIHGQKKGCHGRILGKKKGFVTTTPHSFYSAAAIHCHPCHRCPPPSNRLLWLALICSHPLSSVAVHRRCPPPPIPPSTAVCRAGIRPRHICLRHPPLLPTPVLPPPCKVSFFCNFPPSFRFLPRGRSLS